MPTTIAASTNKETCTEINLKVMIFYLDLRRWLH